MAVVSHYNVAPVIGHIWCWSRDATWVLWPEISTTSLTPLANNYRRFSRRCPRAGSDDAGILHRLLSGLAFSIVLVYLLIVVNFQSWLDPFIMISALPARTRRHCVVLVYNAHDPQRARTHGRHHVHGRRNLEQHLGRELRYGKNDGRK